MDKPTRSPDEKDDSAEQPAVNAIGPAGETADLDVSKIVSGQPAGGPHDLGRKAKEKSPQG